MLDQRKRQSPDRKRWRDAAEDTICGVIGNAILLSLSLLIAWPILTAIGKIF